MTMKTLLVALFVLLTACGHTPFHRHTVVVERLGGEQGTGWFIASDSERSIVATAGHVCGDESQLHVTDANGEKRIGTVEYMVEDDSVGLDACLIVVGGPAVRVVRVGSLSDEFGTRVWYTGYPQGTRFVTYGMLSQTKGGIGSELTEYAVFSGPVAGGASGSPIMSMDDHVVSIVIAGHRGFHEISLGVPNHHMAELQRRADQLLREQRDANLAP